MKAIYLVPPHGELIWLGEKKAVLKKRRYPSMENQPLLLVSGNLAYGIVKLGKPKEISKEELEKTYKKHRVSPKEAKRWWKEFDRLYLYPVKVIERFDIPIPVEVPKGTQTFADISLQKIAYFYLFKNLA